MFLEQNDPAKSYGGLQIVVLSNGEQRWMCKNHAKLYRVDSQKLSRVKVRHEAPKKEDLPPVKEEGR